jgi:hypothetical protein
MTAAHRLMCADLETSTMKVHRSTRRSVTALGVARETAVVAVAALLYFFVRGLIDGREADAFANADWLVDLERRLGFFWEPALQRWSLGTGWVDSVANWVYIWGHWPVIAATLVWLLLRHRAELSRYRNAMLISGAIGVVCFVLFPMAPPRFLDALGFVDTVTLESNAYRVLQPPSLTNQFAAMPSLHVGWNLLMGIALYRHATIRGAKLFGILMPVAMYTATILTANHYLLDGVVGSAVALTGLAAAEGIRHRHLVPRPASLAPLPQGVRPERRSWEAA